MTATGASTLLDNPDPAKTFFIWIYAPPKRIQSERRELGRAVQVVERGAVNRTRTSCVLFDPNSLVIPGRAKRGEGDPGGTTNTGIVRPTWVPFPRRAARGSPGMTSEFEFPWTTTRSSQIPLRRSRWPAPRASARRPSSPGPRLALRNDAVSMPSIAARLARPHRRDQPAHDICKQRRRRHSRGQARDYQDAENVVAGRAELAMRHRKERE